MKKKSNKRFKFGLISLSVFLLFSIIWPALVPEPDIIPFLHDEHGRSIAMPPYPPSADFWFGTDREGVDILYALIKGAKYTLLFALAVSSLRLCLATVLGLLFRRSFSSPWMAGFLQAFTFMPQSLLAIIWLGPFILYELRSASPLGFTGTVVIQLLIVVWIGIPSLAKMVAETADHLYQLDFMESARTLGGTPWHIAKTHLFPHILPRLVILAGRQLVQVLTLILHLAIFHIFIGGTTIRSGQAHDQFSLYYTGTYEWAGLIGSSYQNLMTEPYIVFFPVLAYTLLILLVNITVKGFEQQAGGRLRSR
ncbi:ABC transporter permease [Peribacillus deserti]|uniref:ABC transmembrane type-1 domain-containing protein n=1 Tax=Peribacillus deserti TaxID=673318 RepID=A0A2N5M5I1_9BACI|nr:ABC transporter permease subunit [Peribacillus deserti]PLT29620.1 hypothetical protein CUU66_11990 [Peribacillus deserti]